MTFGSIVLASYWTVMVAELVTDKSLCTVASLSLRFRFGLVFLGTMAAFGGKMLLAVLFGQALTHIPPSYTTSLSALGFFVAALAMWMKKPAAAAEPLESSRVVVVPFASLFLTEWADAGQITAAALAAQCHLGLAVWIGGTLALTTKGAVAMTLGAKLRHRMPEAVLRGLATGSCSMLGLLALRESFLR